MRVEDEALPREEQTVVVQLGQMAAVIGLVTSVGFVALFILGSIIFDDSPPVVHPPRILSQAEYPSPSSDYVAIVYSREVHIAGAHYQPSIYLTIKRQTGSEYRIGEMGDHIPEIRWNALGELLITLHARPHFDSFTNSSGVKITYHLSEELHTEFARREVQRAESKLALSEKARACRLGHFEWAVARNFYRWARENADNGDPDPGSWVSTIFPTDCSKVLER